jgi:hypothetical protein
MNPFSLFGIGCGFAIPTQKALIALPLQAGAIAPGTC